MVRFCAYQILRTCRAKSCIRAGFRRMGRQRYIISGSLRVWLWNLALLVGFSGDCFALDPELAQELACLASYEELADDRTFDSDSEWEQQV